MDLTETQLSSEPMFEGSFLNIYRDRIRLPNGHESERVVVRHPGAACVLAVTDDEKVVLVRQWRYAVGKPLLELPAGKLDAGEDPAVCALRELAEETPYTAGRVSLLHTFYTAPGFCDENMYLYQAHDVREGSELTTDEDEFTETVLLNRADIQTALNNNEIADAKTLVGLQYWLLNS
ncbi:MAG: NUDIX hydrolase [Neisseria sp.]|nr:NUDIX hydrolase [Neisseria sp.]